MDEFAGQNTDPALEWVDDIGAVYDVNPRAWGRQHTDYRCRQNLPAINRLQWAAFAR